jgi:hypothetical protein
MAEPEQTKIAVTQRFERAQPEQPVASSVGALRARLSDVFVFSLFGWVFVGAR